MSSELAIEAHALCKHYEMFARPADRLKRLLWGRRYEAVRVFQALENVNLSVRHGEVVGLVGRNGAGKSTLLQLLCGTLPPTSGELRVHGRVAALLELGAGFNPEFTGIENVFMNGAILGLTRQEITDRLAAILEFADIGDFVHQPVKTYSSGMFVRLAFAVATSVEPDILVIDEALSVGDGAFARKSFDRIMGLKNAGKTILFCSHSMYQVEALCSRAIWLESGRVRMDGPAADVTSAYATILNADTTNPRMGLITGRNGFPATGTGRIVKATARTDSEEGSVVEVQSCETDVALEICFEIDPALPVPGVAVGLSDANGMTIASATSVNDGFVPAVDSRGRGRAVLLLKRVPLLKGSYWVTCFLSTEDGIHPYDQVTHCLRLNVHQQGLEQGVVSLPHEWQL